jgi:hypothetical protein
VGVIVILFSALVLIKHSPVGMLSPFYNPILVLPSKIKLNSVDDDLQE